MEALTKSLRSQLEAGSKLRGYACSGDELDALLEARRVKAESGEAGGGDALLPAEEEAEGEAAAGEEAAAAARLRTCGAC